MIYGYARVSTDGQTVTAQVDATRPTRAESPSPPLPCPMTVNGQSLCVNPWKASLPWVTSLLETILPTAYWQKR